MTKKTKCPNVLIFFTDQQRWDTVGAHGNPLDLTPNFDMMAEKGRFIRNSFTCQPVCGPARSAFQTGKYPTTTGCYRNDIPLPPGEKTLAHYFGEAGYETGYIGKWHLAETDPVPQSQQGGYDEWLAANILEFTSWPYQTDLFDRKGERHRLPGYRVDALADAAIRHIDRARDKPFFLFLSFLEPHHQNQHDNYPAPVGYAERIARRITSYPSDLDTLGGTTKEHYHGYMGMVARLDEAFGRIIDALISRGELDNTIILFTSDHGCHFKTRNAEYKRSCHEASIRVPTLLAGPGLDGKGDITRAASLIDLPPTLLDAAGIEIPAAMEGRSLLRPTDRPEDEVFIQISESQVGRALRAGRWKYCVADPDADGWSDSASRRYVETHLYDLERDPAELDNLVAAPDYAGVRDELAKRLAARIIAAGEAPAEIVPGN
ncbi:sulfatase-like hydrolase/transferase (plasmid) [Martelella lutilitoris]|uniref:Sulfatase-like hydrolase/transferase n=1 Tax=Martelella lutilitoris TaxID=2583532 RepID=A0A7T7KPK9_9HYPH|nr:sulfatase-like hydrolase/transferase [Martelella lutilitoris]QQM33109.1 sulfatase-like hydrolase/transferase [Martelella lutilitoris]QRX65259.1 sulfatase-like hydrolase/transferase [Dysgonomonadaceae bacterium zrk40]